MSTKLYNADAERSVLAVIITTTYEIWEDIFAKVNADDFFVKEYHTIFVAMHLLFSRGSNIDYITVSEAIERIKKSEDKTNYLQILLELPNTLPSATNYQQYIDIVRDYSLKRKIAKIAQQASKDTTDLRNTQEVLQQLASELDNIELASNKEVEPIGNATQEVLSDLQTGKKMQGLHLGFPVLDSVLFGLQAGELVIVGARAGTGKTAFALNVLNYVGNNLGQPCLFFSLEMPQNQIAERLLSLISCVPNTALREPENLTTTRKQLLAQAGETLKSGAICIDDTTDNTVQAMTTKARQFKRKNGLSLVVVDYLQFVRPAKRSGNRFLDVGDIARDLKAMARKLQVPVIALCQLNRALDTEERTPTLSDLRESGEIENNADIIMFLHNTSDRTAETKNIDLIIGKFRRGPLRAVHMRYRGEIYKFTEQDKTPTQDTKQVQLTELPQNTELPF